MIMDPIEGLASVLGAVAVWLVIRRSIWNFPVGLVMVLLYVYIFYQARLYSDMLLQLFFAAMQIHGFVAWQRSDRAADEKIVIRQLSSRQWWVTGCLLLGGFAALGYGMGRFTNAASPYMDAFVTTESVLAQWWLNARYLDNWILWMAVNQVAIFLYASKGLWPTVVLYGIFEIMAIAGYLEWRKKLAT